MSSPIEEREPPPPTRRRSLFVVLVAVAAIAAVIAVVALVVSGDEETEMSTSSTTAAPPATVQPTAPTTATPQQQTAADDLERCFAAATEVDRRLRAAAVAINATIGPADITITRDTVDAIAAADPSQAATHIPPGLPDDVMLPVLTVQEDLLTRFHAFSRFFLEGLAPGRTETFPRSQNDGDAEKCLANGSGAAARFAGDLAAARSAAATTPAVAAVAPDSRPAADLAIRLAAMMLDNAGCDACGSPGTLTGLTSISWEYVDPSVGGTGEPWDGYVGDDRGVAFRARYTVGGWAVEFNAC